MIDTVIINAKIVTPNDITHGCIAIDGGRIEMVGPHFLMPKSREVIDAEERFVIPGFVDPHVHYGIMSEPTFRRALQTRLEGRLGRRRVRRRDHGPADAAVERIIRAPGPRN